MLNLSKTSLFNLPSINKPQEKWKYSRTRNKFLQTAYKPTRAFLLADVRAGVLLRLQQSMKLRHGEALKDDHLVI